MDGISVGAHHPSDHTPRSEHVAKFPFLSEEWLAAARSIRESYRGKTAPASHPMRMNLRISDVPFGPGSLDAHIDSSSGELEMDVGHLESPDLTVGVAYDTAKAIVVEQNPQAGLQAFMAGRVKVDGDMTKLLLAMQEAPPDATAIEMAGKIKEITA
jgi:hypothetical protein